MTPIDRFLGRIVRRPGFGEGPVIGRNSDGWLIVKCYDGLSRETPEDRVILCPELPTEDFTGFSVHSDESGYLISLKEFMESYNRRYPRNEGIL